MPDITSKTEIPLTNSTLKAFVDPEVFQQIAQRKWYLVTNRNVNYACTCMNNTSVYMHHLLYGKGMFDHKDRNGLNNQAANVRKTNHSLNAANQPKRGSPCYSKYKGVSFDKRRGKWTAGLSIEGTRVGLGYYKEELDAAKAYNQGAVKYFGDHAFLNVISEVESPSIIALAQVKGVEIV